MFVSNTLVWAKLEIHQHTDLAGEANRGTMGDFLTELGAESHDTQDNYLDAYVRIIKETDPTKTSLVFSCGMGAVRTTFAMVRGSKPFFRRLVIPCHRSPHFWLGENSWSLEDWMTPL